MLGEREEQQHVQRRWRPILARWRKRGTWPSSTERTTRQSTTQPWCIWPSLPGEELADNVDRLVENGTINLQQELHPQIVQLVAKMMSSEMVRAAKAGQNPGELLYAMAVRRGFAPRRQSMCSSKRQSSRLRFLLCASSAETEG